MGQLSKVLRGFGIHSFFCLFSPFIREVSPEFPEGKNYRCIHAQQFEFSIHFAIGSLPFSIELLVSYSRCHSSQKQLHKNTKLEVSQESTTLAWIRIKYIEILPYHPSLDAMKRFNLKH